MCQVYLLLGGNLGDRILNLSSALQAIQDRIGEIELKSAVYETKAWGVEKQPDYLNLVVVVKTELKPIEILNKTQKIEQELGRKRLEKWGARTMDIDILFIDNEVLNTERLTIPHPLINVRKFVLLPLLEIAPNFIHPIFKDSIKNLYLKCDDRLLVEKLNINL